MTAMQEPLLSPDEQKEVGIANAAWQLEDVMRDKHVSAYPQKIAARNLYCKAAQAEADHTRALFVLVLLTIFETPSWCDTEDSFFTYVEPSQRCQVESVKADALLLSSIPYLPPGLGVIVELVAVFFISRKLWLERKLQVDYFDKISVEYSNLRLVHVGLFMVVLEILDCFVFVLVRPSVRVAFVARTGLLCMMPAVLNLARCIRNIVGEVITIACFYLATVIFFTWVVVEVFANMTGEVGGKPINVGLDTFFNSFHSLFVAGSTADFVWVFLPSYTALRSTGFLWCAFLVIAKVLLLSLVLDTLVCQYMEHTRESESREVSEKIKGIRGAFRALTQSAPEGPASSKGVSEALFLDFVHELSSSPGTRTLSEQDAKVVFKAVDKDGSKNIDEGEFCDICGVLQHNFWVTPKSSVLGAYVESKYLGSGAFCLLDSLDPTVAEGAAVERRAELARSPAWVRLFVWFRGHHIKGNFDWCMNWVLLLNMIMVLFESMYDLNCMDEPRFLNNLELLFSFVYVAEVGLNLTVMSWAEYWSQRSYQFDFVVTWLLLFSSILDEMVSSGLAGDAKRYINILRLLRLLRVVKKISKIKEVQTMVEAISTIVSTSKDILTLLSVVVLFYSALGVQMWGGLLYEGNKALEETEYDEKDWYILNFQDVPMSLGVWVVSLLSEYVQDFPDALQRVSRFPVLSKCVFISFYLFSVCIVFELVKAFTIEVFLELKKSQKENINIKEFKTLEDVKHEFDMQGQSLHYRVVGDPMLQVRMTEALEEMDKEFLEREEEESEDVHQGMEKAHYQHENPRDNMQ